MVQGLERCHSPHAVVDAAHAPADVVQTIVVNPPAPREMTGSVVFFRPFAFEHCLSFAVTQLLLPIRAYRIAPMMPHHRRWTETQRPTTLLQAPADIHVVTRHPE